VEGHGRAEMMKAATSIRYIGIWLEYPLQRRVSHHLEKNCKHVSSRLKFGLCNGAPLPSTSGTVVYELFLVMLVAALSPMRTFSRTRQSKAVI
jgi:hypothetical protein